MRVKRRDVGSKMAESAVITVVPWIKPWPDRRAISYGTFRDVCSTTNRFDVMMIAMIDTATDDCVMVGS
jgi:hypothetical protein